MENGITELLNQTFGYSSFQGPQQEVIESALRGEDAVVLMPTGGGKSICYQIPMLARHGMGIVVSPLIALMQDQVSALQQNGVRAEFLNSTLSSSQSRDIHNRMNAAEVDILYVAPERLMMDSTLQKLQSLDISLIAIDESHCVSQWGHDFRRDYLNLIELGTRFAGVPRMALTATATARSRGDIVTNLALHQPKIFISSFDRPNIHYAVVARGDAKAQLLEFLGGSRNQCGIVYCLSRKKVEATAHWLVSQGFNALPYHAGMEDNERAANQHQFLTQDDVVMVATIAFGMGIDKPEVRFVAHLDLPGSIEAYYQETGRAGRDGRPARAWMVYGLNDVVQRSQMVDQSDGDETFKRNERQKLDALLGWCEVITCRRQPLLSYFDQQLAEPCGNCDNCQSPPRSWDGTEAAQKLLSCVYRTGQRFGSGHVIDVLVGKVTDKVNQHQHEQLSTFGIGVELSNKQWRSVIRQLIVSGYLFANADRYGALQLTDSARPLLKGEHRLMLREEVAAAKTSRKPRTKIEIAEQDQPLWEALRQCRKELADQFDIPPYMVFHDSTLGEILHHLPTTRSEIRMINGVGDAKLEKFADEFLDVVRNYKAIR